MHFRASVIIAAAFLLCACGDGDWDHLTTFNDVEHPQVAAQQSAAPPDIETASISPPAQTHTVVSPPQIYAAAPPSVAAPEIVEGAQRPDVPVSEVAQAQHMPPVTVTVQTETVVTTPPASHADQYCRRVGRSAADTSQQDGLDISAQQQALDAVYQQCLVFYGSR